MRNGLELALCEDMKTLLLIVLISFFSVHTFAQEEDISDLRIDSDRETAEAQASLRDAQAAKERSDGEKRLRIQERTKLKQAIDKAQSLKKQSKIDKLRADNEIVQSKHLQQEYSKQIKAAELLQVAAQNSIELSKEKVGKEQKHKEDLLSQRDQAEQRTKEIEAQVKNIQAQTRDAIENARVAQNNLNEALLREKQAKTELELERARSKLKTSTASFQAQKARKGLQDIRYSK